MLRMIFLVVIELPLFASRKAAINFIETMLNAEGLEFDVVSIQSVPSTNHLVSVIDIIREGYGKYTHYMLNNVPLTSEYLH
jgi:hypothetical protein